ncbi:anhydro-N-acetylmuramic acid kinase [Mesorhizobium sp. BAC0120]|uniref:anhydro-N-acetylmuramic acid kinase n=1 Tax=Mesorhizobium sp. BAC0120 TaxID=3090670 RepID=UPI00298BDDB6|nr:anhydro-N-acetylmuramic acid kinase [Mesorhizobium sp. BAC0120]MDW6023880.1 anhydro-N-acetylmuramic acid kinase [Mesorhizobium sp. BAC0120]
MALMTAIGLMSGTSMDGIDAAMLRTDGESHVEFGPTAFFGYPAPFRRAIEAGLEAAKAISRREDRPGDLAQLEEAITERHVEAVRSLLERAPADWRRPEVIGFHGQTVLHRPQAGITVQLGDGPLLARATGIPVIYDMRANDMKEDGQGAPLVPAYHAALARSLPEPYARMSPVVFVNIGGISNITYVGKGDPIAFDTGPGNALIDQWVAREGGVPFDADGTIASEGSVVRTVVKRYLDNPFFAKSGPKSLDRGDFTLAEADGMDLADGARTLAAVSAEAILKSVEHLPDRPSLWIVSGGGRKNPHMFRDLKEGAARTLAEVILAEDACLRGDFIEAEAWAHLAVRSLKGLPLTFPTTTGCRKAASGGVRARPI